MRFQHADARFALPFPVESSRQIRAIEAQTNFASFRSYRNSISDFRATGDWCRQLWPGGNSGEADFGGQETRTSDGLSSTGAHAPAEINSTGNRLRFRHLKVALGQLGCGRGQRHLRTWRREDFCETGGVAWAATGAWTSAEAFCAQAGAAAAVEVGVTIFESLIFFDLNSTVVSSQPSFNDANDMPTALESESDQNTRFHMGIKNLANR